MQRRYTDPSWALGALDPLGRAPLFVADNPYVYAGANPLSNVDPSGNPLCWIDPCALRDGRWILRYCVFLSCL